jgi:hypothetical protein
MTVPTLYRHEPDESLLTVAVTVALLGTAGCARAYRRDDAAVVVARAR